MSVTTTIRKNTITTHPHIVSKYISVSLICCTSISFSLCYLFSNFLSVSSYRSGFYRNLNCFGKKESKSADKIVLSLRKYENYVFIKVYQEGFKLFLSEQLWINNFQVTEERIKSTRAYNFTQSIIIPLNTSFSGILWVGNSKSTCFISLVDYYKGLSEKYSAIAY